MATVTDVKAAIAKKSREDLDIIVTGLMGVIIFPESCIPGWLEITLETIEDSIRLDQCGKNAAEPLRAAIAFIREINIVINTEVN